MKNIHKNISFLLLLCITIGISSCSKQESSSIDNTTVETTADSGVVVSDTTQDNITEPIVSSGSENGPTDFPAEAKTLIDQLMAAKQAGDDTKAATIQKELDTKFPNLPKPGAGGPMGGSGGLMPAGGTSSLDTSSITTKYTDVVYATDSSTQKMDIYLPNEGKGPFPVIVAIHGGAFAMGNKTGGDIASMLKGVEHGYAVVMIDYRLSGEAIFPAAIDDIQKAIVFIKNNATKYNLNGGKIATWGDSAGGNLSALAGTKGNVKDNTNVQASIDWYGPIHFSTMDSEFATLGVTPTMGATSTATSPETKYLGKTVGTTEAEELVKQASPTTYITSEDPAFYIQHGTADKNIPITQSENFAKALTNAIGSDKVTFEKLQGAGHGGTQFDSDENLAKIFAFLDKYLK